MLFAISCPLERLADNDILQLCPHVCHLLADTGCDLSGGRLYYLLYNAFLNKEGKAAIIPLFNDFMRSKTTYLQQESTVKNHIYFTAGRLAQRIRVVMES